MRAEALDTREGFRALAPEVLFLGIEEPIASLART
jgi:hypothetical protein